MFVSERHLLMTSITIAANENLVETLKAIAERQATTLENVLQDALQSYIKAHKTQRKTTRRYSFIGIGHSGHGKLSTRAEDILAQAAHRREGWSLR
jgi:metal-responsive CopG/Arc/MetJ family transcriptional regulator